MSNRKFCDVCQQPIPENQLLPINGNDVEISLHSRHSPMGHRPVEDACFQCLYIALTNEVYKAVMVQAAPDDAAKGSQPAQTNHPSATQ